MASHTVVEAMTYTERIQAEALREAARIARSIERSGNPATGVVSDELLRRAAALAAPVEPAECNDECMRTGFCVCDDGRVWNDCPTHGARSAPPSDRCEHCGVSLRSCQSIYADSQQLCCTACRMDPSHGVLAAPVEHTPDGCSCPLRPDGEPTEPDIDCPTHGAQALRSAPPVEQPDEVMTPGALEPTDPYHGDGVPNTVLHDLRAIMAALGIDDYARPYSPHEVVQREVLPAIERLRSAPPVERP